jgi:hypothetical protein
MKGQNILERDAKGKCTEGECRDRALEGQRERQKKIKSASYSTGNGTVGAPGASSRNEPPGFLGGHV